METWTRVELVGGPWRQYTTRRLSFGGVTKALRVAQPQVDANGEIVAVTWSPMFEGVLMCAPQDVGPYYEAHATFQTMMTEGPFAEKHTIRMNMEPGDCMVFNNRRLVHGRTVGERSLVRG